MTTSSAPPSARKRAAPSTARDAKRARSGKCSDEGSESEEEDDYIDPEMADFIVPDGSDDEEDGEEEDAEGSDDEDSTADEDEESSDGTVSEDDEEVEEESDVAVDGAVEALDHIDTRNIIEGKRIRRAPDKYFPEDARELLLEDIPADEYHYAVEDEDFSEDEDSCEDDDEDDSDYEESSSAKDGDGEEGCDRQEGEHMGEEAVEATAKSCEEPQEETQLEARDSSRVAADVAEKDEAVSPVDVVDEKDTVAQKKERATPRGGRGRRR